MPSSRPVRHRNTTPLSVAAAVLIALVWSCSSDSTAPPPPPPTPANVTPVSGTNNQTAVAGSAVASPPSVTVTTAAGAGVAGASVTFAVTGGGGSVTGASATTDAQGVATVGSWVLGTTAGANTMTATVNSIVATFTATGTAGPAASIAVEAGDGQSATTGTAVAVAPAAKVVDANSNPVQGESVTFTAMNNGVVAGSPATTDANGIATVTSWTLGDLGANTLEATFAGAGAPAVFNATSIGVPATVTISAGDNQTQAAGTTLGTNPAVEVRDGSNVLLEGISVTFAVASGGGSASGGTATTDASGIATVGGWTLGTTPGANTMTATVTGITPVTFNATGVVGPASQIQITAGDAQTGTVGAALANVVQATIQDQFGNGVSGETLVFTPSGNGSVDNTNVVSDASGNASVTWTLATAAGAQTLDVAASIGGVTPATANATANPDVATAMTVSAGDNQSAVQGTAVATAPAVLVADQFANPVPGISVTFTPSGDGSVTGSPATTDASGVATVGSWTLTSTPGANTLDANAASLSTVTFNATATVQVGSIEINAGDGQSATVNTAVANPVRILVRDVSNNPAVGIPVTFAVSLGGGSVTGAAQVTDGSGIATVGSWTLGTAAGANELTVSVDSDPSNLFVLIGATGTAGAASSMTVSAGDGQSAMVSTAVPVAPAVLVTDAFSNPIVGASVTFTPSGDGQVTGSPATTDATGVATVGSWTLATAAGANTLTASSAGVTNVVFNATGTQQLFNIAIQQGNDQTAPLSAPLPTNPTVRVTDQGSGLPVSGVNVSFTPRSGEGSVNSPTVVTDANGDASVQWTPGRIGANFMDVVAGNASTQFFAIASNSPYHVELIFLTGGETTAQKEAFGNAAGRWMSVITGDLSDVDFGTGLGANACGFGEPNIPGIVDDLRIFVKLEPIDGQGGVLGAAGPCAIRTASSPDQPLTIVGVMRFDTADLANMQTAMTLGDVILHEMGHVLGIGTLWNQPPLSFLQNPSLPSSPGADTHFNGTNAIAAFNALPGGPWMPPTSASSVVPVENTQGGQGTRDGHWRESTMVTELMTGFISGPGNPLSTVTVQSLLDIGYTVDITQADAYTLGNPSGLRADGASNLIHLKDDIIRIPLRMVDNNGRLVRVVAP